MVDVKFHLNVDISYRNIDLVRLILDIPRTMLFAESTLSTFENAHFLVSNNMYLGHPQISVFVHFISFSFDHQINNLHMHNLHTGFSTLTMSCNGRLWTDTP